MTCVVYTIQMPRLDVVSRMFFLSDDDSTLLLTSFKVWDRVIEVSSGVG